MIYLVYGDQEMLVNKMVSKLSKEFLTTLDEFNYVELDAKKVSVEEIMDELTTLPFGNDRKVVNVANAYFLTNSNEVALDTTKIEEYINNETDNITFILSVYTNKLDEKKTLLKKLKTKAKFIELNSLNKKEMPRVVKQMFLQRKADITDSALDELLSRVDNDMYAITNEVEKLTTYSNVIHIEDVKALTPRKLEDNVFDLIDAMFKKNINKAFYIYNDLKRLASEPISLVSVIATQVRFLYQVLTLYNKGYSESNIANELSVHPYRVKMGIEKVKTYQEYELEDLLERLSKLDVQIKTGDIDRFVGLELFILSMAN